MSNFFDNIDAEARREFLAEAKAEAAAERRYAAAARSQFRVGDKVTVQSRKYRGIWTVIKINPKNLKLEQNGMKLNCPPELATKAGDSPVAVVSEVPFYARKHPGTVVKVSGRDGYWIVIKDSYDKVNIAKVGGDEGRSLNASHGLLTVVPNPRIVED